MKPISFSPVYFLLSLASLTIVSNTLSARAETPITAPTGDRVAESAAVIVPDTEFTVSGVTTIDPLATESSVPSLPEDTASQVDVQQANLANTTEEWAESPIQTAQVPDNNLQSASEVTEGAIATQPIPGTVETSAEHLTMQPETSQLPEFSSEQTAPSVAQVDIDPGRTTRGGASYIGLGGNIGLGGGSDLGDGAFAVISKIGLTRFLSARPAVLFGGDVTFLVPLTYDFVIQTEDPFEQVPFAPYVGGGVIITTEDDTDVGFLLTGGIDVPLTAQFVGNASLNVGFLNDDTDVGLMLGVGYSFVGF